MSQAEVIKAMKNKKWYSINEIAEITGNKSGSISCNLSKLFKSGEVFRKEVLVEGHHKYLFKLK